LFLGAQAEQKSSVWRMRHRSQRGAYHLRQLGDVGGDYQRVALLMTFDGRRSVEDGIGQQTWESWLKQVPAQKSILIFDTCESSAATALTRGSKDRETAIDRLRDATGRSVITAARQATYEGYQGHGVLTYTILDALTETQGEPEHEIDLYQLASQIDREVPEISYRLFGVRQRPYNKIEGNFPVGVTKEPITSAEIGKRHLPPLMIRAFGRTANLGHYSQAPSPQTPFCFREG
jgi:hypothetical protein